MTEFLTARDCLRARFCVRGIREKCEAVGADFQEFVRNGIPLSEAEKIDDHHIKQAVEVAKRRIGKG
jgi:hypothetical protein